MWFSSTNLVSYEVVRVVESNQKEESRIIERRKTKSEEVAYASDDASWNSEGNHQYIYVHKLRKEKLRKLQKDMLSQIQAYVSASDQKGARNQSLD